MPSPTASDEFATFVKHLTLADYTASLIPESPRPSKPELTAEYTLVDPFTMKPVKNLTLEQARQNRTHHHILAERALRRFVVNRIIEVVADKLRDVPLLPEALGAAQRVGSAVDGVRRRVRGLQAMLFEEHEEKTAQRPPRARPNTPARKPKVEVEAQDEEEDEG